MASPRSPQGVSRPCFSLNLSPYYAMIMRDAYNLFGQPLGDQNVWGTAASASRPHLVIKIMNLYYSGIQILKSWCVCWQALWLKNTYYAGPARKHTPRAPRAFDNTWHKGTWYQVSKYLVPGTWCQVPGTWYGVPGTRYQVPGTWYQVPGTCTRCVQGGSNR